LSREEGKHKETKTGKEAGREAEQEGKTFATGKKKTNTEKKIENKRKNT